MWSGLSKWWWSSAAENERSEKTGPARNIPIGFSDMLAQAKLSLKSPDVVDRLKHMSNVTESQLHLTRLRHVEVPPRQLEWPCTNPLFKELREAHAMRFPCSN